MNQVEVDAVALDAESDRLLATAPAELTTDPNAPATTAPGTGGEGLANGGGSWNEVTPGLVAAADIVLLPQWNLRDAEKEQLGRALGDVLDQIFPGGLSDPRWAPYVRLAAVASAIAFSRIDPATGKLPPFGRVQLEQKPADGQAPAGVDRRAA